jgi:hypothetical protein
MATLTRYNGVHHGQEVLEHPLHLLQLYYNKHHTTTKVGLDIPAGTNQRCPQNMTYNSISATICSSSNKSKYCENLQHLPYNSVLLDVVW